jgi:hypothetical protein
MSYTVGYEIDGGIATETFETLDEALDRASDRGLEGILVDSVVGPEGSYSLELVDVWKYRKLDTADPDADPTLRESDPIPPPFSGETETNHDI